MKKYKVEVELVLPDEENPQHHINDLRTIFANTQNVDVIGTDKTITIGDRPFKSIATMRLVEEKHGN